jgi:predicted  nucleic acid-binding Zn-ribbon protein
MSDDLAHELRVLARLMENKAPVRFREQDADHLRKAAAEIERLNKAVAAKREAILELIEAERTANGHLYDGAYCLANVAAAIRARG